jgi:hypothetical protein
LSSGNKLNQTPAMLLTHSLSIRFIVGCGRSL